MISKLFLVFCIYDGTPGSCKNTISLVFIYESVLISKQSINICNKMAFEIDKCLKKWDKDPLLTTSCSANHADLLLSAVAITHVFGKGL